MPSRRRHNTNVLVKEATQLAFAVPQVITHRVARMALARPVLSDRDRKEFRRMGTEKMGAFMESWNAMAMQAFRANQALTMSFARAFWSSSLTANAVSAQLQSAALGVLGKGMAPVRRRAVANSKRLARTKLR